MLIPSKMRRRRWAVAGAGAVVLALAGAATAAAAGVVPVNPFGTNRVGQQQADGRILLPDNHWISPYGQRTVTFSAQTIGTAISPDGTKVASQTGGDNAGIPQLSITDAATGSVLQTFGGTGVAAPVYSPDGTALYTATSTSVLKYVVGADGKVINPSSPLKIALPSGALPYGLGISADGKTLYAAESGINKLGIIDTATGSVAGQVAVGNAPQGVAVVDGKVFVSNRGGRPAVAGDTTNLSDGTAIVSDPSTGASATGTVSVVDPTVKTPVTAPTAPDTSATAPDIIDVDFADGTPAEHAQNLPETTYGAPSINKDAGLGQNVATFNGATDAYTYPFGDQWSKVAKSFTVECKFRWNGAAVDNNGHGVCEDLNGGGIGVDILNGEPMTYAHIGGAYKEIFDPHPVVSGTWYDVITTWDGSTLREYVNGTQVATMAASGALGLPSPNTSWHWTIGANAAPTPAGIEAPARVSVASSKVWSKALPGGPSVPVTVPTAPDTSAKTPDVLSVDFADGTPVDHAQNLPATTYGAPSIAKDAGLGQNVGTFNGTTDAYTYPFGDQWSKVAKGFTVECKFRWNDPAGPTTADHGVCSDTNSGGIGVHVVNGEPMTYAHIGGAYKTIYDPNPVVPGTWYDVVTTWDGSTLDEYVNGTLVASQAASGAMGLPQPNATAYHFTIGADASAGGIEMISPVSIATSKIWSTALPSAGTTPVYDIGNQTDKINVGLQPAGMTVHDGAVFVANTNADTVSIIDAASHQVTQTFAVQPLHGATVGAAPNSIAFADDSHLLVSVGRDNAIAVFNYTDERQPVGYKGLIPTDWYPNQVSYDAKVGKVIVSNQQGIGTNGYQQTYKYQGTLTSFSMPADKDLRTTTQMVFHDNAWDVAKPTGSGNAPGQHAAIPVQLGQPSAIKHVFLIIKENRTYDQILGDIGKGNSSTTYLSYGAAVTANQHSLANTFTLFDNFYDSGMLSADGHQWLVQGDNNDYQAQNAASVWARSYPYPGGDALSYQQSGFIWNTVQAAGGTVRNYGEFEAATTGKQGTWQQYYADSQIMEGKAQGPLPVAQNSAQWVSDVPSLNTISNHDYPHFDPSIPDQYRTDIWEQDFKKAEQTGVLPSLTTMELGVDHTGGAPTGTAQNADNDLAVGRIISDISHSQFWKDSAVFVVEDDTQAGNDHVDGHRGPLFIASPYAKRGVVNSEYYSQVNVVKTIEQILGAQPLNQMDQAAIPMYDAFTNTPDLMPYNVLPNQIPLTQGVSNLIPLTPTSSTAANPSAAAAVTATNGPTAPAVPAAEQAVASQWTTWYQTEATPKLTGANAAPDATNPAQLNRYDWYTATNWSKPYPGDAKILAPNQVPGRNLPSNLLGD